MSKYGDDFYVKTYGGTYSINNDEPKAVRGGQKWMVYLRKFHVATFKSEEEALEFAEQRNRSPNKAQIVADYLAAKEQERIALYQMLSYKGILARMKSIKSQCDALSEEMRSAIIAMEHVMGRNGDE